MRVGCRNDTRDAVAFEFHYKREGKITALSWINDIVVDETTGRVKDGLAFCRFQYLEVYS